MPPNDSQNQPKIRYRDLRIDKGPERDLIIHAIEKVLDHGQILLGPEVQELEEKIAQYIGMKHCVGLASGTDAVFLALRSLGIKEGDEVITTPLSWIATLNALHFTGATPIFVDVREDLNINPELIEAAITPRTKAILPVHFTGRVCDMEKICAIAKKYGVKVVEDAAQAFGAKYQGRYAGSFGDINAFSMNPMKVLPSIGEAGVVVTNDDSLYELVGRLRYLGTIDKDTCVIPSLNSKIDTVQAAVLLANLQEVEKRISKRIALASRYTEELREFVICPTIPASDDERCVFFDYTVLAEERDRLMAYLSARGIETRVKYPLLMTDQPAFTSLPSFHLPVARAAVSRLLSLPNHDKLSERDVEYVVTCIKTFYRGK